MGSNVQNAIKKTIVFLHRENPILRKKLGSEKLFIIPLVCKIKITKRN